MKRWYIFEDAKQVAATATKKEALEMVRQYQARQTHYLLKAEYSLIYGEEEFVSYKKES